MPKVTYLPWGYEVEVPEGTTVFDAARDHDIGIPTACVGKGNCGLCRVKVVGGEQNLPPFSEAETKHLGNVYYINKLRLSCQMPISGDVTVEVPDAVKSD